MAPKLDLFGIGWRGELAAAICAHLDHIDLVEVIADDYLTAPKRRRSMLRTLAAQVPVVLHGVTLGLASAAPVEERRLTALAKLIGEVRPVAWSEHLAFVRAGGREIGHLAAPPRTAATLAGATANVQRAAKIVGMSPCMENIATLLEPPLSTMGEAAWIREFSRASGAELLLDLHNLYANAVNFGLNPHDLLGELPLERVRMVHLSGGRWTPEPGGRRLRLLDDHLHDVPEEVFGLLTALAAQTPQPLTVILERDGCYPEYAHLLAQIARARVAVAHGRQLGAAAGRGDRRSDWVTPRLDEAAAKSSNAPHVEEFLVTLFVDAAVRRDFLASPEAAAHSFGLTLEQAAGLAAADQAGLAMAAASYAQKRLRRQRPRWFT